MGERFYLPVDFPSTDELEAATLRAIQTLGGEVTPGEIKEKIIEDLKLSKEVLAVENSDGLTMLIDYRLRWARTSLKNKGEIVNISRGKWALA